MAKYALVDPNTNEVKIIFVANEAIPFYGLTPVQLDENSLVSEGWIKNGDTWEAPNNS
jgi:hypothetical protein